MLLLAIIQLINLILAILCIMYIISHINKCIDEIKYCTESTNPVCFDAKVQSSGSYKYRKVQAPTHQSWYYNAKIQGIDSKLLQELKDPAHYTALPGKIHTDIPMGLDP